MDTSRDREDPKQMFFMEIGYNNDLTRYVKAIAERNGTDPDKMRLFIYPTKKDWEAVRAAFIKRADWSRA